ncbi:MAG: phosphoglycerate kinase [bacterium]|nr:phosphoglycerate kinase [bacterium]
MQIKTFSVSDIQQKTVVMRVDFNVPLREKAGILVVSDDRRVKASLPTIRFLLKHKAKVVLLSHLGRPSEKKESKFSLAPVARYLNETLKIPTAFADDSTLPNREKITELLQSNDLVLLENMRFSAGEKKNDPELAKKLAALGDVFINDAFSSSHRAHASVVGIAKYLPAFAGLSLQDEVAALTKLNHQPRRPFVAVVGGAKISDKVGTLVELAQHADIVLTGGGVANTFMKADGLEIHKSYIQDAPADLKKKGIDYVHVAKELISQMKTEHVWKDTYIPLPKILYPLDVVAAKDKESDDSKVLDLTHDAADTPHDKNLMYLDIGPKTTKLYCEILRSAKTIFWNGPLGVFENKEFAAGTKKIAQTIAQNTGTTIIGGGDTAAAIDSFKLNGSFTYVSNAGSASLEFLAGKELPGLKVLMSDE